MKSRYSWAMPAMALVLGLSAYLLDTTRDINFCTLSKRGSFAAMASRMARESFFQRRASRLPTKTAIVAPTAKMIAKRPAGALLKEIPPVRTARAPGLSA
jgi:hypothetical protein